ncbi:MAG: FkbM family methyltransferase [Rhodospirillales bacterium]|jgi:FkbM family methyltransferase|nr:FkbM family methyltransferase [Rhodospirillales bacterium]MDP6843573.1 FkbM family methyltransferase [Rhodospirillales bacterium]
MSKSLSKLLINGVKLLTLPMKPYRRANTRSLVSEGLVQRLSMAVPGGHLDFESTTARSLHDANSITHGEPETVRWIDQLPEGSVLWDIGANIGVYSLYAAYVRNIRVAAFEPGAASHAALCRNIEINKLNDKIQPYCIALSDQIGADYLYMADTGAGHSMHGFGQARSVQGAIDYNFRQSVIGYTIDGVLEAFRLPPPDYIKLDVDGIEAKIIKGGGETLGRYVKSIIVEADQPPERIEAGEINKLLDGFGFRLRPGGGIKVRNLIFDKQA